MGWFTRKRKPTKESFVTTLTYGEDISEQWAEAQRLISTASVKLDKIKATPEYKAYDEMNVEGKKLERAVENAIFIHFGIQQSPGVFLSVYNSIYIKKCEASPLKHCVEVQDYGQYATGKCLFCKEEI